MMMETESKPIIIADKLPKEYAWVIIMELQHSDYVVLRAIDKYLGTVERLVNVFDNLGIKEESRENGVKTINLKNNTHIIVNQFILRKIPPLRK